MEFQFPSRINLVFGEQWCLAKLGSGSCEAKVVSIQQLEQKLAWKHADYRWLVELRQGRQGYDKVSYLIRSDHHPRRALRGGIPVMIDDVKGSGSNHLWYFEFSEDSESGAFQIRSYLSDMYLQVDDSGNLTFETGKPENLWRYRDAAGKLRKLFFRGSLVRASSCSPLKSEAYEVDEDEKLEIFGGSPSNAFDLLMEKQSMQDNPFMKLDELLTNKPAVLCDDTELFPQGMTIHDVFPTLFGANSDLFRRFHEMRADRDINHSPPHPLSSAGASWGAVASLTCKVPVLVLGLCKYKEVQRFSLCHQGDEITLAVQIMGKVQAGRFGEFPSEMVYLFSQSNDGGAIRIRLIVPAPTGAFSGKALDGARKSASDFRAAAYDILQDWNPDTTTAPPANDIVCSCPDTVRLASQPDESSCSSGVHAFFLRMVSFCQHKRLVSSSGGFLSATV
jgi:hypothetical protein